MERSLYVHTFFVEWVHIVADTNGLIVHPFPSLHYIPLAVKSCPGYHIPPSFLYHCLIITCSRPEYVHEMFVIAGR